MTKVVPGLGLTILDNNLNPIIKINISVAEATFRIAKEDSPILKGNTVIKEMKIINGVNVIRPIFGETINYGVSIYFDLEILPTIKVKSKVDKINLNFGAVKISNDEDTKYGVSEVPFGESEGVLTKDSNLKINDRGIDLNLEDFNIVLGDSSNTYKEGVYLRIKLKMIENFI